MKKTLSAIITLILIITAFCSVACSNCEHVFEENVTDDYLYSEANCTSPAIYYKSCRLCGEKSKETFTDGDIEHTYYQGQCVVCEKVKPLYEKFAVSDYEYHIKLGEYPQSRVTNETLLLNLESYRGELPTKTDKKDWTPMPFYVEKQLVDNAMWYKDVYFEYKRYRAVYFVEYKPYDTRKSITINPKDIGSTWQDNNGYYINTVYWFKWEPIEWRILIEDEFNMTLLVNLGIDSREYFYDSDLIREIDGKTVYPNNYVYSNIREWLNEEFINTAFSDAERAIIMESEVDNSAKSANLYTNPTSFAGGVNDYASEKVYDKIYMISVSEASNPEYGFSTKSGPDLARRVKATDYAECMGITSSKGNDTFAKETYLWTRSPYQTFLFGMRRFGPDGEINVNSSVWHTDVAPGFMMNIQL